MAARESRTPLPANPACAAHSVLRRPSRCGRPGLSSALGESARDNELPRKAGMELTWGKRSWLLSATITEDGIAPASLLKAPSQVCPAPLLVGNVLMKRHEAIR